MSSPLNAILGDNPLLGAAMNIATMAFPQAAIASQLTNMAVSALGGAITGAMDQMTKEQGMPNFLADIVKNAVASVLPQFMSPVAEHIGDAMQDKVGNHFDQFKIDIMKDFVDAFKEYKSEADKKGNGAGKGEGVGGAAGGGGKSWFVALMTALGELQNKQAEKLQELSGKVSDSLTGADASKEEKKAEFDAMQELKAEAKLQDVIANVVKSVGDAVGNSLATSGRAQ